MDEKINFAISRYLKLIKEIYPDIESAYLFGSYSKGLSSKDSDIDIAIIFTDLDDSKRFDLQVQLMVLASKIDSRIEPHPLSKQVFNSGNPFSVEIRNTGIKLAS